MCKSMVTTRHETVSSIKFSGPGNETFYYHFAVHPALSKHAVVVRRPKLKSAEWEITSHALALTKLLFMVPRPTEEPL